MWFADAAVPIVDKLPEILDWIELAVHLLRNYDAVAHTPELPKEHCAVCCLLARVTGVFPERRTKSNDHGWFEMTGWVHARGKELHITEGDKQIRETYDAEGNLTSRTETPLDQLRAGSGPKEGG
jgi:YD repeat-containing protein